MRLTTSLFFGKCDCIVSQTLEFCQPKLTSSCYGWVCLCLLLVYCPCQVCSSKLQKSGRPRLPKLFYQAITTLGSKHRRLPRSSKFESELKQSHRLAKELWLWLRLKFWPESKFPAWIHLFGPQKLNVAMEEPAIGCFEGNHTQTTSSDPNGAMLSMTRDQRDT